MTRTAMRTIPGKDCFNSGSISATAYRIRTDQAADSVNMTRTSSRSTTPVRRAPMGGGRRFSSHCRQSCWRPTFWDMGANTAGACFNRSLTERGFDGPEEPFPGKCDGIFLSRLRRFGILRLADQTANPPKGGDAKPPVYSGKQL